MICAECGSEMLEVPTLLGIPDWFCPRCGDYTDPIPEDQIEESLDWQEDKPGGQELWVI